MDTVDSGEGIDGQLKRAMSSFMYVHPVRERRRKNIAVMIALSAALLMVPVLATMLISPATLVTAQNSGLKILSGDVKDSLGSPVAGSNVNVSMYDATTSAFVSSLLFTTLESGFYTVTFGGMGGAAWEVGDRIVVTATSGSDTGSNESIADAEPVQTIDVTIGTVIPEFSSYAVVGVVSSIIFMMIFSVHSRRSRSQK